MNDWTAKGIWLGPRDTDSDADGHGNRMLVVVLRRIRDTVTGRRTVENMFAWQKTYAFACRLVQPVYVICITIIFFFLIPSLLLVCALRICPLPVCRHCNYLSGIKGGRLQYT